MLQGWVEGHSCSSPEYLSRHPRSSVRCKGLLLLPDALDLSFLFCCYFLSPELLPKLLQ